MKKVHISDITATLLFVVLMTFAGFITCNAQPNIKVCFMPEQAGNYTAVVKYNNNSYATNPNGPVCLFFNIKAGATLTCYADNDNGYTIVWIGQYNPWYQMYLCQVHQIIPASTMQPVMYTVRNLERRGLPVWL